MSDFLSNFEKANKNAKRLSNKILIDGKLISPSTNNKIDVINPSTGENIGEAPQCNKVEVDLAVKSKMWQLNVKINKSSNSSCLKQ